MFVILRSSVGQVLYFSILNLHSGTTETKLYKARPLLSAIFLYSPRISSVSVKSGSFGQDSLPSLRKAGPCHHRSFGTSSSSVAPRDTMSAGLRSPSTQCHSLTLECFKIYKTLLETNISNSFVSDRIHQSTFRESVQKWTLSSFSSKANLHVFAIVIPKQAANNSSLGTVSASSGTTFP